MRAHIKRMDQEPALLDKRSFYYERNDKGPAYCLISIASRSPEMHVMIHES